MLFGSGALLALDETGNCGGSILKIWKIPDVFRRGHFAIAKTERPIEQLIAMVLSLRDLIFHLVLLIRRKRFRHRLLQIISKRYRGHAYRLMLIHRFTVQLNCHRCERRGGGFRGTSNRSYYCVDFVQKCKNFISPTAGTGRYLTATHTRRCFRARKFQFGECDISHISYFENESDLTFHPSWKPSRTYLKRDAARWQTNVYRHFAVWLSCRHDNTRYSCDSTWLGRR